MIWHKAWLESRARFLTEALVMALAAAWAVLDSERMMARLDRHPPITFDQYIAMVYAGRVQLVWVACVLLLGAGGLLKEAALGTASFTLALPVSRRRWTQVRAALGCVEACALALVPALVIPMAARFIGHSYPFWEALKFSALLWVAGTVFMCATFFWSSIVPSEGASLALGGLCAFIAYTTHDYLYRWLPYFRMSDLLSGGDLINRATGYLEAWPWPGVFKSVAIALLLCWTAIELVDRRDF